MNNNFDPTLVAALVTAVLALVAPLLAHRRVERISITGTMLLLAIENAVGWAARFSPAGEPGATWRLAGGLGAALLPLAWLAWSVTYGRADVRGNLSRWRLALVGAAVLPLVLLAFVPEALTSLSWPSADPAAEGAPALAIGVRLFVASGALIALANLERTYRATAGASRWRAKFMLLGFGLLFAVRAYTCTQTILLRGTARMSLDLNASAAVLACGLVVWSLLRSTRSDVEIYPSPTLIRHSLTVAVAGGYLLIVGVLAKVVAHFGGSAGFQLQSLIVLAALVALAAVLQSDRVHLIGRRFVSRHLRRPVHDWRQVWRTTADALSSGRDQPSVCRALVDLVAPTFNCLSASLWLVDSRNESLSFAASTVLSTAEGAALCLPPRGGLAQLIRHCQAHPGPLERSPAAPAALHVLSNDNPTAFPGGQYALWLPLISRGELLGLLGLGRRARGAAFTVEDMEILQGISEHAAANLRNAQLSQHLLQAKEMEAFQTMAAFFVHDLKNAAASLSLMLDNLPTHFDDARFRDDTLRGIQQTVTHVNHLIGRLTQLRNELHITPGEFDFNQMVARAVAGCGTPGHRGIETDLAPLPRLRFDPDQLSRVVTNLVLNATEATGPGGRIRIATRRDQGWAVLSVEDNGCGMTPRFVHENLFRPFQTTKKHGLGVGMFQSKMIVEAHQGRLSVESEPGRGTRFQVLLPLEEARP